ncbi:MAG TPA: lecithin--cholesterol acyltransferase [Acidimicrobiia bacterium]
MARPKIRDVVVVLPGIIGSVLEKDGKDLWALSGSAIWNTLTTMGRWLDNLKLEDPDADDGVVATRLMDTVQLVPGLVKVDGYTGVTRMIQNEFEVIPGSIDSDAPANYFEFPYDWRRDNRRTARELERFVSNRLRVWRDYTNNPDAKAILLAHSMGGIVSRYFCEVLDGWEMCRALVTFGTPHRGSPNALSFLANGFKKLFVDLTEPLRSFPSAHQLLPIYPLVADGSGTFRVAEAEIPGIDAAMAADGLTFHREIEAAVEQHSGDERYQRGFTTLPFVGTRQPTLQSASLSDGMLTPSRSLPEGVDPLLGDGDGTVPRLSAIPIELSTAYQDTFVPERHSGLHNHGAVLQDLRDRIVHMQTRGLAAIRAPEVSDVSAERPGLSVDLDDLYLADEAVAIRASLVNGEADAVWATVVPLEGGEPIQSDFEADGDGFSLDLTGLDAGGYRIEVGSRTSRSATPPPVHDVFVVAG